MSILGFLSLGFVYFSQRFDFVKQRWVILLPRHHFELLEANEWVVLLHLREGSSQGCLPEGKHMVVLCVSVPFEPDECLQCNINKFLSAALFLCEVSGAKVCSLTTEKGNQCDCSCGTDMLRRPTPRQCYLSYLSVGYCYASLLNFALQSHCHAALA